MDSYCTDHKHLGSHSGITLAESQTAALLNNADANPETNPELIHHLKAIALREEMMARAETYDIEQSVDYAAEARTLLGPMLTAQVPATELGQLLYQFKRLDIDGDGIFSVGDFTTWVYRIDPDFKAAADGTVAEWLRQSTTDGAEQFDFKGYVEMILDWRAHEENNWGQPAEVEVPLEFKQTPFWDLRLVALHAQTKTKHGWMLKRGYLFTKESLNAWKLRYVRTHAVRTYEPPVLEYWDADPNVEVLPVVEGQPAQVLPVSAEDG